MASATASTQAQMCKGAKVQRSLDGHRMSLHATASAAQGLPAGCGSFPQHIIRCGDLRIMQVETNRADSLPRSVGLMHIMHGSLVSSTAHITNTHDTGCSVSMWPHCSP